MLDLMVWVGSLFACVLLTYGIVCSGLCLIVLNQEKLLDWRSNSLIVGYMSVYGLLIWLLSKNIL